MTLSELSIRRPVLASVVCLLIVVFGLATLMRIPVRELPNVDRPVVSVTTTYTGAAPEIIDADITEIIDGAVAGISGVKTITSESRTGRSRTTVEFVSSRNIDEATNDVRDAIGRVRGRLPDNAEEPRIVKSDADADPVMRIAVTSDRMTAPEITDYIERNLADRFSTLDGVANVDIFGSRRFAIRIWLDRRELAARKLTVADIEQALRRSNVELPAGEIESVDRLLTVRLASRLSTIEQFKDIVIDRVAGYPIRLGEVARIERGVEDDTMIVRANGRQAVGLGVLRQSQANTVAVSNAVRAQIEDIRPSLPEGMEVTIGSDEATFVAASIREVLKALLLSLGLVVLVILLFLRSVTATLVPAITIPVALIGCLPLILMLGFSLNILTLLALLLAIGLVVDDAIIMLENIVRRHAMGEPLLVASVRGARQVTFAIIATSLTLVAVFVPISFLEGDVGRLFGEFGFVMASAVLISTFVALTACPALASRILARPRAVAAGGPDAHRRPGDGGRMARAYRAVLSKVLDVPVGVIAVALAIVAVSYFGYHDLQRELTPREDRGVLFIPLSTPQGSTLSHTDTETRKLEAAIAPEMDGAGIDTVYSIVGSWQRPFRAFVVLRLDPWEERNNDQSAAVELAGRAASTLIGASGFPVVPAGLGMRGSSSPLRVVVGGPEFDSVKQWATALLERAEQNPGLRNVEIDFEENQPQLTLDINRARADDLGISVETIASTLQTMLASREATTYIDRGREYSAILQAEAEDRRSPDDVANIFIRAGDGETLVPLSALVTAREEAAAPALRRYNRMPSITLSAALVGDYTLGSAIEFIEAAAAETLPPQASVGFSGQSLQYLETSRGVAVVFALAVLIVFLVLAAQFESFLHPVIIMLSVPLAVAGAIYALWFTGLTLNLYSQIGVILLVGLMAKNGILMVEFANQLRDEGASVRDAILEASAIRLRPILMTVISTILGAVPLVLASGAGAESRIAIGTVIIGGLGFASVLTLFLTPVLYNLMAGWSRPRRAAEQRLEAELGQFQPGE
ncbi:MAG TPA: efflux RND transporter permease subunit [Aestuariivirgaceae bacterium]|nr:efflux RND transporter permease subunit [Aestuariivirgaceae bacterium]